MKNTLRIGLLWHSARSGNLGVGALTVGNMALARRAAERAGVELGFTLFGPRERRPSYVDPSAVTLRDITGRYMASPGGFWRDLGSIDLMLDIGGGDSFTDIYPDKRFAYIAATKAMTVARGVPLILSPQTIGPFSRQPHSAIAAWCCRRAAAVFVRDPMSMAALHDLAPDVPGIQSIDVAFALPFTQAPKSTGKARFGLNVSALLYGGGHTGKNEFGIDVDYRQLTDRLLAALANRADVEVHLVPHVLTDDLPHEDDGRIATELAARYPGTVRAPDFTSPSEAKSYISGLDFLTGARMHATIAAYSSGVPVVPISYSRKFEGLFGGLEYPWLVPVKGKTTDAAVAYVLEAFDKRAAIAADIAKGAPIVEAGLERYVAELAKRFSAARG